MSTINRLLTGVSLVTLAAADVAGGGNGKNKRGSKAPEVVSMFYDADGVKLPDDDDVGIAEAYKDAIGDDADYEVELTLDPEQIIAVLRAVPGDETDDNGVRTARFDALVAQNGREELEDLTTPPSAVKSSIAAMAFKFGGMIKEDGNAILDRAADNKEELEGAPLELAPIFVRDFGGEIDKETGYILRCPAVDDMPIPFTSAKNKPAGYNRSTDRYKWSDQNGTEHSGHFIGELVRSIPGGNKLASDMADLVLMAVTGYDRALVKNKEFLRLYAGDKEARESKLDQLKTRHTSRCRAAGRAIAYLQVINRLDVDFPKVQWEFTTPGEKLDMAEASKLRKPIKFAARTGRKTATSNPISLSQFISLQLTDKEGRVRLSKAKQDGASVGSIMGTFKRKKKTPDGALTTTGGGKDAEGKAQSIPTPQQVVAFANMFNTGLDPSGGNKNAADAYRAKLQIYFNAETPERDEELMSFRDMHEMSGEILLLYAGRIQRIINDQTKKTNEQPGEKKVA